FERAQGRPCRPLHHRKRQYQSQSPKANQQKQRQRTEVAQVSFAFFRIADVSRGPVADSPCGAVEDSSDAERAPDMARQNYTLERVPEYGHKERKSENSDENVHRYVRLA